MSVLKTSMMLTSMIASLAISAVSYAETITIARVTDAKVFAEFNDKYPAVLNYFSQQSEQQLIAFYQQQYGEISTQSRKRGRLTLTFNKNQQQIRVILSEQNNRQQVDILVDKKQSTASK